MDSRGRRIGQEPRRPQDDDQFGIEKGNPEVRADKVRFDVIPEVNLAKDEIAMQREGRARPQQGIGGMRDALARLQMAKDQYGFEAFGEEGVEMKRVYNSLKDGLGDGQAVRRARQQAEFAVKEDARVRRGDISDSEIARQVSRKVANARPDQDPRVDAESINIRGRFNNDESIGTVSYTHLTLPTILLV